MQTKEIHTEYCREWRKRHPKMKKEKFLAIPHIDKDIPLPPKVQGPRTRKYAYPWTDMRVGHSFFVPGVPSSFLGSVSRAWADRHSTVREPEITFVSRVWEEDGILGVRCWRVK